MKNYEFQIKWQNYDDSHYHWWPLVRNICFIQDLKSYLKFWGFQVGAENPKKNLLSFKAHTYVKSFEVEANSNIQLAKWPKPLSTMYSIYKNILSFKEEI